MTTDFFTAVDKAHWTRTHWMILASTAIGFFLWGIINTLGYAFYPEYNNLIYLVVVAAMPLLGTLLLPWLSDAFIGRKRMYLLTMSLYGAGSLTIALDLLLLPKNTLQMIVFLVGYGISMIGVEGEVPVGLALLAEVMPLKHRQKALIVSPNFENIGAAAAAAIAYATYFTEGRSYVIDSLWVVFLALLGLTVALILRLLMPESVRWLAVKGDEEGARRELNKIAGEEERKVQVLAVNKRISLRIRFAIVTIWSLANYLTWGLMAFVLADYYFTGPSIFLVMFWANLGASAAGLVVPAFIDKIDMRNYTLISFSGAVLSFIPVLGYVLTGVHSADLFYAMAFENLFFITMTWFVRTIYEPELFPTEHRGLLIGAARAIAMSTYTISTYATAAFAEWAFVVYGMMFQGFGLAAALWWRYKGYDVRMKTLESLSGTEVRPVPIYQ
ncbi:MAG: MFS transporter [Thermoprotei archaeon]